MSKKKTYELSVNSITHALKFLDLPVEQVTIIQEYKNQFPFLLEEDESVLISIDQLWEALDTPYYNPPESSGGFEKTRTPAKEKEYRRKKFTQWRDEVALKEIDGEVFNRMVKVRGGKRKETFINIDDAKMIAMMVPGEQGRKIRRYFVTLEKVVKQLWAYNCQRNKIEDKANEVYRLKLSETGFKGFEVAAKDKIRFNTLLKKIAGARNVKETDLENYYHIQREVFNAMQRGRTDEEMISFFIGD